MPTGLSAPTFSFELYPPRSAPAEASLFAALDDLSAADPEFISVTYRPTGPDREASLAVLGKLIREHRVHAMAHLTCVGSSYEETARVIREFLDEGVTSFLALRGDPPPGQSEGDDFLGDFATASELVQLIHNVQAERSPFSFEDVPGFPSAKRLRSGEKVTIAVAAFPNGHPKSHSRSQDIDTLLAKQAAGANLAITQLFFEADEYLSFVSDARAAGVTMRILPGIMPVLSVRRLKRIVELSEEKMPSALFAALEAAPSAEAAAQVGIDASIELARNLLAGGADGLHLYTFNSSHAPLAVLRGAGLLHQPITTPVRIRMPRVTTAPALLALVVLALAGCAAATPESSSSPSAEASGACEQVSVVVDFGPLDQPSLAACSAAGAATDVLAEADVTTEGTVDYGDQVVCRVNDEPSAEETVTIEGQEPFTESCETLNSVAYWALWVKNSADAEWEYAQEGVNTLQLTDGQSLGLVYTPGTESIPPQG